MAHHSTGYADDEPAEPVVNRSRSARAAPGLEHLGAYRPLIAAISEELERFVATDLRLHLAIAEQRPLRAHVHRDRAASVPTSTGATAAPLPPRVRAGAGEALPREGDHRAAAERERHRPLAVRRPRPGRGSRAAPAGEDAAYADLLAELRSDAPVVERPFEVTLVGRWSDTARTGAPLRAGKAPAASPVTPMAGAGGRLRRRGRRRARAALCCRASSRDAATSIGKDRECNVVVVGPLRQSPALRAVARARHVVGDRLRFDQRRARRGAVGRRVAATGDLDQHARRPEGASGDARRVHRAVGLGARRAGALPAPGPPSARGGDRGSDRDADHAHRRAGAGPGRGSRADGAHGLRHRRSWSFRATGSSPSAARARRSS